MKDRLSLILATGFGLGLSPIASGTVGSLLGVVIVFAAHVCLPPGLLWQGLLAVALAVAAIPICDAAEGVYGRKDDGRIVADEYMTFPLCVLGLPWPTHPVLLLIAFVVCRALDVIKPPPARQSQVLRGGLGIVADDVISSLYALGVNHLIWWGLRRWGCA